MEEKIKAVIEEIRPYMNMDGGDIEFIKYEDNYVYVSLKGHCALCEAQDVTLKDFLLDLLQKEFKEIEGVINVDL